LSACASLRLLMTAFHKYWSYEIATALRASQ